MSLEEFTDRDLKLYYLAGQLVNVIVMSVVDDEHGEFNPEYLFRVISLMQLTLYQKCKAQNDDKYKEMTVDEFLMKVETFFDQYLEHLNNADQSNIKKSE